MKNIKKISLILVCCLIFSVLSSCSLVVVKPLGEIENKEDMHSAIADNTEAVYVSITSGEDFEISSYYILPVKAAAGEYFRQLCNRNDVVIKGVDEGFITSVNEIKNDGDYAWMFYINGEISEVGVKDYIPEAGDKLELKYLNWVDLYNM